MQNISTKDFYSATRYNLDTQNQLWMETIQNSHDIWCDCDCTFAHLLSSIFPPGHQDRTRSIDSILQRDYKKKCLSGGGGEGEIGMADFATERGDLKQTKEEPDAGQEEELDALMAAAAAAEEEEAR